MNPQLQPIIGVVLILFVMFVMILIMLSRYTKVGPNQVLFVSGRKVRLADGRVAGFRVIRGGGGTFVFPVIEKADVLSLEVVSVEMPRVRAQCAGPRPVQADCAGQIKINGDDTSIIAAAEYFLNKSPAEIKGIVQPILEKHLVSVLQNSSMDEVSQNPAACAARVQTSASPDLGKMGLSLVSVTISRIA